MLNSKRQTFATTFLLHHKHNTNWRSKNLLAEPKNIDHVSCLCLREQESPEFSQFLNLGGSLEFFQVPEPICRRQKSDSLHRAIGIFPCPRVQEEVRNFLKSQGLYKGDIGKNRGTPRASLLSVLRQQIVFEGGGSLEFSQVPRPRTKLGLVMFSSPRVYIEGERSEFP